MRRECQCEASGFPTSSYGGCKTIARHLLLILHVHGDGLSYEELAGLAACSVRTVRVAIAEHPEAFFVQVGKGRARSVVFCAPSCAPSKGAESSAQNPTPVRQNVRESLPARDLGDSGQMAQDSRVVKGCCSIPSEKNTTTNNQGARARFAGLSAADLESRFTSLLETVDVPAERFASLVAVAMKSGRHPGSYLASLLSNPSIELSREQRDGAAAKAKQLLALVKRPEKPGPMAPEVERCLFCGERELIKRPANRLQCSHCCQTFAGVLKHVEESECEAGKVKAGGRRQ